MSETLLEELKRYVQFDADDEAALRALHPLAASEFTRIAGVFYDRILTHEGARTALEGGESRVGQLKVTLVAWMDKLLSGPWDEAYYEQRARIGRMHVRISLPQHYMFGAMNVIRQELGAIIDQHHASHPAELRASRVAVGKILDLELAIMLHTYREDLVAQRLRHERLATFGQLVGSIGHELRNPLGVIESSLYILRGRIGTDERAKKHVDRIGEQLVIANSIVSALLDMIRDRPLAPERVEVRAVLDEVSRMLAAPPGVRIVMEGMEDLPALAADPAQLRQALANLVENAVHAVGDQGEVRVVGKRKGETVEIAVEDTGPGVDPEVRRRLFEPLITTKAKGIGLGLALVKRIVERHRGTVTYTAPAGSGARFVVELPVGERA
jgi:signal transduction histidine kinase